MITAQNTLPHGPPLVNCAMCQKVVRSEYVFHEDGELLLKCPECGLKLCRAPEVEAAGIH